MRTSATYMFDRQKCISEVSICGHEAEIEFRGDDHNKVRQHYIRITGLTAEECKILSLKLSAAAKAMKEDPDFVIRGGKVFKRRKKK